MLERDLEAFDQIVAHAPDAAPAAVGMIPRWFR
jgi:hypothetical protein